MQQLHLWDMKGTILDWITKAWPADWEGYNKKNNWIIIGLLNDQHMMSKILIVDDEGLGVLKREEEKVDSKGIQLRSELLDIE